MKRAGEFCYNVLLLLVGSALCAVAVNAILIPQGFLSSGLTGVALIIYYKYPVLTLGLLYLLVNIPVFFLGLFYSGARFVSYTALGMALYTVMLHIPVAELPIQDKMLGAVCAAGLTGLGVAIMLRSNGSGGGSEILGVVLRKTFSLTLGTGMLLVNVLVLLVSALLFPMENVLYTLVYVAVSAYVTDMVFSGLSKRQAILIISREWSKILSGMTNDGKLGATLILGKGGFEGADCNLIYTIAHKRKVPLIKCLVAEKDPDAYVAVLDAIDVTGTGVSNQPRW